MHRRHQSITRSPSSRKNCIEGQHDHQRKPLLIDVNENPDEPKFENDFSSLLRFAQSNRSNLMIFCEIENSAMQSHETNLRPKRSNSFRYYNADESKKHECSDCGRCFAFRSVLKVSLITLTNSLRTKWNNDNFRLIN